jgi:hypothetical protein
VTNSLPQERNIASMGGLLEVVDISGKSSVVHVCYWLTFPVDRRHHGKIENLWGFLVSERSSLFDVLAHFSRVWKDVTIGYFGRFSLWEGGVIITGYFGCYFLWVECYRYHFVHFECYFCGEISSFLNFLVDLSVKLHVIVMVLFYFLCFWWVGG